MKHESREKKLSDDEALRRIQKLTEGAADEKEDIDGTFEPISAIDSFGPGIVPRNAESVQRAGNARARDLLYPNAGSADFRSENSQ